MSQTITVEFDVDAPLPERLAGYTSDGDPVGEPMTLLDVVIEHAAEKLVARAGEETKRRISDRVETRLNAELDARMAPIIEEALTTKRIVTGPWGEGGTEKSIAELIIERAQDQLKMAERGYGNRTVLAEVVHKQIDFQLTSELTKAVEAAKADLVKQLQQTAAAVMAETIRKAVITR